MEAKPFIDIEFAVYQQQQELKHIAAGNVVAGNKALDEVDRVEFAHLMKEVCL